MVQVMGASWRSFLMASSRSFSATASNCAYEEKPVTTSVTVMVRTIVREEEGILVGIPVGMWSKGPPFG